jgi:hypothetical protein
LIVSIPATEPAADIPILMLQEFPDATPVLHVFVSVNGEVVLIPVTLRSALP